MRLFIEPTEPLLFRTGRPFDAGQNNFAESQFPPTPETLQGAIRAAIANYWDPDKNIAAAFDESKLVQLIGNRTGYGRFRVTGIALGRYLKSDGEMVECLYSAPAHIMQQGMGESRRFYRLIPCLLEEHTFSNLPDGIRHYLKLGRQPDGDDELKPIEGWLTEASLHIALGKGDLSNIKIINKSDVFREESRLGIGIQTGTKAAEEGYLYQMLMKRMNHQLEDKYIYGFVVDIDLAPLSPEGLPLSDEQIQTELHLPSPGWMTLGGEQRTAHFRVLPSTSKSIDRPAQGRSLLYLATPACFMTKTGWKPSPKFAPLDAPITAAINRYESIGGWKLNPGNAGGENKIMRRCVPAGSVYFFDKKVTLKQPLTDYGTEIGYGIIFEGEW